MGAAIPTTENTLAVESKYARIERERKFLLKELPEGFSRVSEHRQIWDNYIAGTRLRLRKIRLPQTRQYICKLTQKYAPDPADFSRTIITNTYLSAVEYEVLSVFEGNEIRKNRYSFMHDGRVFAIDIFMGEMFGLILAETEFETDEEMEQFSMPSFAVADVTNEEMFTGARLAHLTFEDVRAWFGQTVTVQASGWPNA